MLLGKPTGIDDLSLNEQLIIQLILQQRYAEVYELLIGREPASTSTNYNLALCLHWVGRYREALNQLDLIRFAPNVTQGNKLSGNSEYMEIRNKQNLTDGHLHAVSEAYLKKFPDLVQDAVIRLKTDCWLQLGDYSKVTAIATPIAHKGYKNIAEALELAQKANDK